MFNTDISISMLFGPEQTAQPHLAYGEVINLIN